MAGWPSFLSFLLPLFSLCSRFMALHVHLGGAFECPGSVSCVVRCPRPRRLVARCCRSLSLCVSLSPAMPLSRRLSSIFVFVLAVVPGGVVALFWLSSFPRLSCYGGPRFAMPLAIGVLFAPCLRTQLTIPQTTREETDLPSSPVRGIRARASAVCLVSQHHREGLKRVTFVPSPHQH